MSSGDDNSNGSRRRDGRRQTVRPPIIEAEAREVPEETAADPQSPQEAAADAHVDPQSDELAARGEEDGVSGISAEEVSSGEAATEPVEPAAGHPADSDVSASDGQASGEPAPEDPAPLPTARRASLIAAGIVGAVIALGGYFGMSYSGLLPNHHGTGLDGLSSGLEDMGRRLASIESNLARAAKRDTVKETGERLAGLETAVKELGADPKNPLVRRLGDAETKIAQMVQNLESGPAVGEIEQRLDAIEGKLADLGAMPASSNGTADANVQARIADIENQIKALEARPATADGTPVNDSALKALSGLVAGMQTQIKETAATVDGLRKSASAESAGAVQQVETELSTLRGQLDKLGASLADVTKDVDARLAAFQTSIESRDTSELRGMARITAGALAVTALQKAADAGDPYGPELQTLQPLLQEPADLGVLESHAATGVPDLAALRAEFAAATDAILAAGEPREQGIAGSLLASARSLVRVRPTGQVEGEGRGPTVARIEAALEDGDLNAAEKDWESLDEAAKAASSEFGDSLKTRIAVNEAMAKLSTAFTTSLTGAVKD